MSTFETSTLKHTQKFNNNETATINYNCVHAAIAKHLYMSTMGAKHHAP
jgi:hypothetical protein